ncbi:tRNA (guanosine(46)-N7)-methyltransferase TrmB [Anaerorhabdus furcosa]|uniref:tRNA (guanine-N(7)-)-methyltransferase n=1 Tax=Anaerorhabdus furcosa TaxID=118967 RepID=A0A1T4P7N3_9FIRM|nr:tRNA (guanosine(46)-N7)-methyltransferase TrmB [Anaerorhabdus furcosa]SJZ86908.1 tRNA (guanine-N7-)-methyltransferase [Anaerorhabdus furcosa]
MRMRKKSWAEPFLMENDHFVIQEPQNNSGHWKEVLKCDTLHVEIGCGKGDYFIQMSTMDPSVGWIGIEKDRNVAAVAAKKALEVTTSNRCMIALDAEQIDSWFKEGEIDTIHLNFSDPWPKSGYKKRRLSHGNFLNKYKTLLKDHGQIVMKTDNQGLFEFSLVEFSQNGWLLEDVSVDFRRNEHPEDAISEYEAKFMSLGQPIYRAIFVCKK